MADSIDGLLREFAQRLREVVRQEVVAEVRDLVSGAIGDGGRGGRVGKLTLPRTARRSGGRRSVEEMEAIKTRLISHIKSSPGQRAEEISIALKTPSSDIALPLKQLVAEKKLRVKGKARGTKYTVA